MSCLGVLFAGTGSALHPWRGQASVVVDTPNGLIAVDLGCSALNVIASRGFDAASLGLVVLTHVHYDHLCGLPHLAFLKTFRGGGRIYLAGEPGAVEAGMRLASMAGVGPARVEASARGLDEARKLGITIALGPARHTVPAVSVSIEYSGVRVVISGDTEPTEWFRSEASSAALAVHEATVPSAEEARARATGHSTVAEAVDQASHAGLGSLYHLTPQSEAEAFRLAARARLLVPDDGTMLKIC